MDKEIVIKVNHNFKLIKSSDVCAYCEHIEDACRYCRDDDMFSGQLCYIESGLTEEKS